MESKHDLSSLPRLTARLSELETMYPSGDWSLRQEYSLSECVAITAKSRGWLHRQLTKDNRGILQGRKALVERPSLVLGEEPSKVSMWMVTADSLEEYLDFLADKAAVKAAREADPVGYYRAARKGYRKNLTPESVVKSLSAEKRDELLALLLAAQDEDDESK